jgi:hypothetical protein
MTEELDLEDLFEDFQQEIEQPIDEDFLPPDDIIEKEEEEEEEKEENGKQKVIIDDPDDDDEDEDEGEGDDKNKLNEDPEANPFKELAKGLFKLGKFAEVKEDEELDEEKFLEMYDTFTKNKATSDIEEILTNNYGEEGIEMFNDIFIKKVPLKQYLELRGEAENFDNADLDNLITQKQIVRTFLKKTGLEEEEIEEQIENLEESDKLKARAEKYKTRLVEDSLANASKLANESNLRQEKIKKDLEERNKSIKTTFQDHITKGEINGIPLSVKDRDELVPFAINPAYKLQNGTTITEFEKQLFDLKKDPVKFLALAKIVKENLDIVTPIQNKAEDKTKEKVFDFKTKKSVSKDNPIDIIEQLFGGKTKRK